MSDYRSSGRDSNPPAVVLKRGQFRPCLSDETLRAIGPVFLVSMPGEVKDPTGKCKNLVVHGFIVPHIAGDLDLQTHYYCPV